MKFQITHRLLSKVVFLKGLKELWLGS